MAVVPVCYKMPYKDQTLTTQSAVRQRDRGLTCACSAFAQGGSPLSISSVVRRSWPALYTSADFLVKVKTRGGVNASKAMILSQGLLKFQNMIDGSHMHKIHRSSGENLSGVCYASKSGSSEKQLKLLDSYFGKLRDCVSQPSTDSCNKRTELVDKSVRINVKEELEYLNAYLDKLGKDANLENNASPTFDYDTTDENPVAKPISDSKESGRDDEEKLTNFRKLRNKGVKNGLRRSEALDQNDETSDLYLISTLASINIAVFLFEIASPHSGGFHVALGCWSLLTFGPEVCRGYGSFTFFLIYILGGISGNLTSFLHTPEPTVGGTGPIFAIIGAWLIYQNQNKDVISKDAFDRMFQKAVITTAVSFILSHFGPIDDWTHLGAVLTGIVYGFFTCATLQLDDASSRSGQDEGITLVKTYADPCKSLIIFTIFILFLSSLLFLVEPPLETGVPEDFISL